MRDEPVSAVHFGPEWMHDQTRPEAIRAQAEMEESYRRLWKLPHNESTPRAEPATESNRKARYFRTTFQLPSWIGAALRYFRGTGANVLRGHHPKSPKTMTNAADDLSPDENALIEREIEFAHKAVDDAWDAVPPEMKAEGVAYSMWLKLTHILVACGWDLGELTRDLVVHHDMEAALQEEDDEPAETIHSVHEAGHA
jgi:hypothetical protein